jgi:hypothetical protein
MANSIPRPPNYFKWKAYKGRWFSWSQIAKCFWPGVGRRSKKVDAGLCSIAKSSGVYLLAWSEKPPAKVHPRVKEIEYIGESNHFKSRMGGFRNSAGFRGKRSFGHSAAWRWKKGWKKLWVAFFEIGTDLIDDRRHLAEGLRRWAEAVALEEHRAANGGSLPQINA